MNIFVGSYMHALALSDSMYLCVLPQASAHWVIAINISFSCEFFKKGEYIKRGLC